LFFWNGGMYSVIEGRSSLSPQKGPSMKSRSGCFWLVSCRALNARLASLVGKHGASENVFSSSCVPPVFWRASPGPAGPFPPQIRPSCKEHDARWRPAAKRSRASTIIMVMPSRRPALSTSALHPRARDRAPSDLGETAMTTRLLASERPIANALPLPARELVRDRASIFSAEAPPWRHTPRQGFFFAAASAGARTCFSSPPLARSP